MEIILRTNKNQFFFLLIQNVSLSHVFFFLFFFVILVDFLTRTVSFSFYILFFTLVKYNKIFSYRHFTCVEWGDVWENIMNSIILEDSEQILMMINLLTPSLRNFSTGKESEAIESSGAKGSRYFTRKSCGVVGHYSITH